MGLSTRCLRYLVLTYNVIFAVSAFCLVAVNSILLYKLLTYRHFTGNYLTASCITLIAVGLISFILSWVGWKSAWYLHRFHIIVFAVLLGCVVTVEFGCSIWSIVIWDKLSDSLTSTVQEDFDLATKMRNEFAVKRWDKLQSELECCGVGGLTDYLSTQQVPWSCCVVGKSEVGARDCSTTHQRGCLSPMTQAGRELLLMVGLSALAAALLQSIGVICSLYLAGAVSRADTSLVSQAQATSPGRRAPSVPDAPQGPQGQALLPPPAPKRKY